MSKIIGYMDDDVQILAQELETYYDDDYDEQEGGLLPDVFIEYDEQSGRGWGSAAIKRAYQRYVPAAVRRIISKGYETVKPLGSSAATGYLGDILSGKNWLSSARDRGGEFVRGLSQKFRGMSGSGRGACSDKTLHHGVKLFSFSPTARRRSAGVATAKRRKRTRKAKQPAVKRRSTRRRRKTSPAASTTRRRRRRATTKRAPRRKVLAQRGRGDLGGDGFWL